MSPFGFPSTGSAELVSAAASVPEQLAGYVHAVGDSTPKPCTREGSSIFYLAGDSAVLVSYPPFTPEENPQQWVDDFPQKVEQALTDLPEETRTLTILSPAPVEKLPLPPTLTATPEGEAEISDWYWDIPLPCVPPSDKVRNMLRRAERECTIQQEPWGPEAASLAASYCRTRPELEEGTKFIYGRIGEYLKACPDALLFTARCKSDGSLAACTVGDFSAYGTAFYMFAFRSPDAPPGCADALLYALMQEGVKRGHSVLNLGLAIKPGIEFFKKKWHARRTLAYCERTWHIAPARKEKKGFFARLFG